MIEHTYSLLKQQAQNLKNLKETGAIQGSTIDNSETNEQILEKQSVFDIATIKTKVDAKEALGMKVESIYNNVIKGGSPSMMKSFLENRSVDTKYKDAAVGSSIQNMEVARETGEREFDYKYANIDENGKMDIENAKPFDTVNDKNCAFDLDGDFKLTREEALANNLAMDANLDGVITVKEKENFIKSIVTNDIMLATVNDDKNADINVNTSADINSNATSSTVSNNPFAAILAPIIDILKALLPEDQQAKIDEMLAPLLGTVATEEVPEEVEPTDELIGEDFLEGEKFKIGVPEVYPTDEIIGDAEPIDEELEPIEEGLI